MPAHLLRGITPLPHSVLLPRTSQTFHHRCTIVATILSTGQAVAQIITEREVAAGELRGSERYWAYNGLDCMVTEEVRSVLAPRVAADPNLNRTYRFELACQAPAMAMMLRGAAFDEAACSSAIKDWEKEERKLTAICSAACAEIWDLKDKTKGKCNDAKPHYWSNSKRAAAATKKGNDPGFVECADDDLRCVCLKCGAKRCHPRPFNPLSSSQCLHLFYELLELPTQYSRKGERGRTADDDAIDHLIAKPSTKDPALSILQAVRDCRKAHKQIGFLKSTRSCDGRLRQSVNVGATETGRWSASKDPFREGTNFQNIADQSRHVIVADPGLWLFYADLEQAESKIVAYDAEDLGYIQAHNSGDVHTFVAKMVWPELPWPGDAKGDRAVADQPTLWDRDHSFRDYSKHVQHGGNIGQTPVGMARDAHIPVKQAREVYERMYGQAFPAVRRRQKEIMAQVSQTGILTTPLLRKRQFFGRLWEASTQREGLAQTQQSTIADLLNLALLRIWDELDGGVNLMNAPRPSDPNKVWLLAQVHDAVLGLIRPHDITTLKRVIELMTIPIRIRGQICTIGVDVAIGTNFRHFNPKKPETVGGIGKWHCEGEKIILHNTRDFLA